MFDKEHFSVVAH